ncbi:hypothetical protein FJT64_015407 [Amphibalanus amphitrite]|uniref:Secreted protein n=1 Tax=Amphibalanus amphitrite TaxID=1232801 RepID=A0A6A4X4G1_AMPAM|nr:hypothetical protein FJT64_015407 [Amphibalanus amphitrite]
MVMLTPLLVTLLTEVGSLLALSLLEEVGELSRPMNSEELDEDVMGGSRVARAAGWMTSNMSSRSVVPPGYDMLEKPPSPTPAAVHTDGAVGSDKQGSSIDDHPTS